MPILRNEEQKERHEKRQQGDEQCRQETRHNFLGIPVTV